MNKRAKKNLIGLIHNSKSVCISIIEFTEFLKDKNLQQLLDPTTDIKILRSGLYGMVGTTKIFVSKIVQPGHIQVSELEEPDPKSKVGWSIQFDLNSTKKELNRLMDLIAFW